MTYKPEPGASPDGIMDGLARTLRLGLVRYAAKTSVAGQMSVDFEQKVKPTAVVDPWDFWVFSLSGDGFLNGEESVTMGSYFGSLSASRVVARVQVPGLRVGELRQGCLGWGRGCYDARESYSGNALAVKSLGEHWSAGAYVSGQSSTYLNIDRQFSLAPALEYDVFPYSQSTKRQLRLLYKLGLILVKYREPTIYGKTSETLWNESLAATWSSSGPGARPASPSKAPTISAISSSIGWSSTGRSRSGSGRD